MALPLIAAALYLGLWIAAIVAPERSWDGNAYHLPALHAWLHAGRIHWIDPRMPLADIMNGYPKEAEVMSMAAVGVSGSPRLSHCQNLLFLPLGFLAVACLAGSVGLGRRGALLCAALFVLAPVNIAQSVTTYVDTAYACCVAAFVAAVGLAIERMRRLGSPWACLPLLGCAFGLAIGIRPTALFLLPGAFAALAVLGSRRPRRLAYRGAALFLAAGTAWGLAIGGFWYARNMRHDGNPFYPVEIQLFGKTLFAGRPMGEIGIVGNEPPVMLGWSRPWQILYAWGEGIREWPASIGHEDSRTGGLGFLWLLGCVPSMILVLFRLARHADLRERLAPWLGGAGIVLIAFLVTPENWWARYTIWILAVGIPCFVLVAKGAFAAERRGSPARLWALACVALALIESGIAAADVVSSSYPGPRPFHVDEALHAANWIWPANFLYPATRGSLLDQVLAGSDTVAFGPTVTGARCRVRNGMVGQLGQPAGVRRILPVPLDAERDDLGKLAPGGAKYLIWDTGPRAPHCAPPEEVLALGSDWTQVDGFLIAPLREPAER